MADVNPGRSKKLNIVDGIFPQISDTKAGWLSKNFIIPIANIILIETDTGKAKLSDGLSTYANLKYWIDASLTDAQKYILDNVNLPNGAVVLDNSGAIPEALLPRLFRGTIKTVDTYNEMIIRGNDPETGEIFKNGAVIVIDATGDPSGTVTSGGAYYAWYDPDGAGEKEPGWNKVSEFQEPEVTLVDYFKFRGIDSQTIGRIDDDVDITGTASDKYLKFSYANHSKLLGIEANADVTDYENVQAAGAIMYDHAVLSKPLNAATLEELLLRSQELNG